MHDVGDLARTLWPFLVVAAPGLFAVWRQWTVGQQAHRKDRADLVKIAQEAAGAVIQSLRDRLDEVEAELAELRKEHVKMLSEKDAKITLLEGEKRGLEAYAQSLERRLDELGIEYPKCAGLMGYFVSDGSVRPQISGELR